jgi:hypothetical protein
VSPIIGLAGFQIRNLVFIDQSPSRLFDEMLGASMPVAACTEQFHVVLSGYWETEIKISLDTFISRKPNNLKREILSNAQDNSS